MAEYTPDLTYGMTFSASSEAVGFEASKAFDDDDDTRWLLSAGPMYPEDDWIKVDYGSGNTKEIEKLTIKNWLSYGFNSFKLQGSNNDLDWIDIYSGTASNNETVQEFTFTNSTTYRYYKVYCVSGHSAINLSIREIEMMKMIYTTPIKVRNLLPDLLIAEDDTGILDSGTYLQLTNSAVGVPNILKDDTVLADVVDYTFIQPRRITLSVAASGENFIATTHIAFSDADITTFIEESDRFIDNKFINLTAPSLAHKGDWSRYKTGSKILRVTAKGDEDRLAWADSFDKIADDSIMAYLEHTTAGAFDDSGVTRHDATSVDAFKLDQRDVERYAKIT